MARSIDYDEARKVLKSAFATAEAELAGEHAPPVSEEVNQATKRLMSSPTQAYREVLLGCCLARVLDASIDVRLPYVNQGDSAYNGRTLDEAVVNPFLQSNEIPASRGPFLSVFRRSVTFTPDIRPGLRDKAGYDAMLVFIDALGQPSADNARVCLHALLTAFLRLRDAANVNLVHVQRLSLDQYESLLTALLKVPSGGRFPVILAIAMFQTIQRAFNLDWQINWQGINVADRASDVGGDITLGSGDATILSVEVTERPIDRARVEATFNTKILTHHLTDYLFLHGDALPTSDAKALARRYFGQGHEINFLPVKEWLLHSLVTIGSRYRPEFTVHVLALLRARDVPATVKRAWNEKVRAVLDR
jgi:hypothetical protein